MNWKPGATATLYNLRLLGVIWSKNARRIITAAGADR